MKSLLRVTVLVFSLTLLTGYVIYSHVTPNSPPPDPLGLSIDLTLEPEVIEFDSFIDYGSPLPSQKRSGEDLRIITSKNISQPVFSTKRSGKTQTLSKADEAPSFWARLVRSTLSKEQSGDGISRDNGLRIISSKVINQPVFSVHQHPRPSFKALLHLWNSSDGPAVHYVDPNIRFHMFGIHLEPLHADDPNTSK